VLSLNLIMGEASAMELLQLTNYLDAGMVEGLRRQFSVGKVASILWHNAIVLNAEEVITA
jgi:hypothetical protein